MKYISLVIMKRLVNIILLILFGSLIVDAQKVHVVADPAIDLTRYKTYSWTKGMPVSNWHIHELITTEVDKEMAAKGVRRVASEDPDLILAAWASTESDLYIDHPSWVPPLNSIATGIATGSHRSPVTKGTLVIDIADARTKNGVWRGTAAEALEHGPTGDPANDAKTVQKPISKAVKKMFKRFPYPSKK